MSKFDKIKFEKFKRIIKLKILASNSRELALSYDSKRQELEKELNIKEK